MFPYKLPTVITLLISSEHSLPVSLQVAIEIQLLVLTLVQQYSIIIMYHIAFGKVNNAVETFILEILQEKYLCFC